MSRTTLRANTRRPDMAVVRQHRRVVFHRFFQTAGFMLALGTVTAGVLLFNASFHISSWNIATGANAPATLKQQIDQAMQSIGGDDFWSTRPSAVREHLLASVPDLENVEISRTLTGLLDIRAISRRPIGLWQKGNQGIWLVDSHGNAYRPLAQGETADLPLLRLSGGDVQDAAALLQRMQQSQPQFHALLSELGSDGRSWKIDFNRGQQWILSRNRDALFAINRIGKLLDQRRWRNGHWRVDARIDTRWFIRPARQEGVI